MKWSSNAIARQGNHQNSLCKKRHMPVPTWAVFHVRVKTEITRLLIRRGPSFLQIFAMFKTEPDSIQEFVTS